MQNNVLNIIGREITSQIVKEIGNCRAWALIANTIPDVSHHEQLTICTRIANYSGKCSEHLLSCKRASGTKATELYKLISETLISKSVSFDKLVAQTYDLETVASNVSFDGNPQKMSAADSNKAVSGHRVPLSRNIRIQWTAKPIFTTC